MKLRRQGTTMRLATLGLGLLLLLGIAMKLPAVFQTAVDSNFARLGYEDSTLEIARKLEAGANPDSRDGPGPQLTILMIASWRGNRSAVTSLLHHGAKVDLVDGRGQTALHLAAGSGHVGIVSLLLDHGADPNAQDIYGGTPLHRAVDQFDREVVQILIDRGADPGPAWMMMTKMAKPVP